MATNYVQDGDVIDILNEDVTDAVAIESGQGVLIGSLFGVAITDIPVGEIGPIKTVGVWTLPKVSAQAWTVGQRVYWAVATSNVTSTAGSNKLIGVAAEIAANPSATGKVRLSAAFTI